MAVKMQVAIDGPSCAGKGTIARGIATALNFAHLDSGLLYRVVAYKLLQEGGTDAVAVARGLRVKDLQSALLRTEEIARKAAEIAVIPEVREVMRVFQHNFADAPPGGKEGVVIDGRDIGTEVLPGAPCKIFIDASLEVRARRRLNDLVREAKAQKRDAGGLSYERIYADLEARDERDRGRAVAPLRRAEGALLLDTSTHPVAESVAAAIAYVRECLHLEDG